MAAMTDEMENKIIDFLLRAQTLSLGGATATWNQAPEFYIGLLATVGNDAGGAVEITGGNYARVQVVSGLTAWNNTQGNTTGASSGSDGTTENATVINFPSPGAGGWTAANGFGIYDAASGGQPIIKSNLSVPKAANEGDIVRFDVGTLSIQIDN